MRLYSPRRLRIKDCGALAKALPKRPERDAIFAQIPFWLLDPFWLLELTVWLRK